jgi:hypothetical protein
MEVKSTNDGQGTGNDETKDRELRERWEASLERGGRETGGEASEEDDNQDQLFSENERQRLRDLGVI